ncbi:MAG TPA: heterodisulfide reductase-related iron-sulfur binding cluster [Thermoleophilaceae bacterium]|nr:heterodisulfide reductase-related iron-sulfur binding cluster [Thermoleophilaceae bacterium]
MSGYDATRAPQLDLIGDCVHCGFCLPTCPTYVLWGEEMDSPRGRIVLMKEGHEEISAPLVTHLDRCLGCMACVTACPSGVQYDKLIEDARPQLERNFKRPPLERAQRRLIFELFTRPGRLRALAPGAALAQKLGLPRLARRPRVRRLAPRLAAMISMTPEASMRSSLSRLPERFEARGEKRGTVALLQGCVQRVFFGHVNEATARVLAAEGFEVHVPRQPRCCGALALHAGEDPEATALAKATIEALESYDTVIVNAAGCGSAMKDYGHVLRDEPEWAERAKAFSARVRDVCEFLAEAGPRAERHPVQIKVAYHDACHLAHAQGVRSQPRELLQGIPGLELVEPAEWELCCGSAGIYNLVQPEPAAELGERKARNLLDTGAEAVVAGNPGCALQISAHTERLGRPLPVLHPMELLARAVD